MRRSVENCISLKGYVFQFSKMLQLGSYVPTSNLQHQKIIIIKRGSNLKTIPIEINPIRICYD